MARRRKRFANLRLHLQVAVKDDAAFDLVMQQFIEHMIAPSRWHRPWQIDYRIYGGRKQAQLPTKAEQAAYLADIAPFKRKHRTKAGPITPAIKRHALKRARGRCPKCCKPWRRVKLPPHRVTPYDFHHRIRCIDGGKTTKKNVTAICIPCHRDEHKAAA